MNVLLFCSLRSAAIFDILLHDAASLFVTGFSFYLDSFIKGYKKNSKRSEEQFAKECFVSKRHNQNNQWNYLKEHKSLIETDEVLAYILNMERLSREDFENEFGRNLYTN